MECRTAQEKYSASLSREQAELIIQVETSKRKDTQAKSLAAATWLEAMKNCLER